MTTTAADRTRDGRRLRGLAMPCWWWPLAGHAAVLAIWPAAHTLLIDLQVYRAGAEHLVDGRPLYAGGVLLDLPFVYPPFAAVAFVPMLALPLPALKLLWTAGTLALLGYVVAPRPAQRGDAAGAGARLGHGRPGRAGELARPGAHHPLPGADQRRGVGHGAGRRAGPAGQPVARGGHRAGRGAQADPAAVRGLPAGHRPAGGRRPPRWARSGWPPGWVRWWPRPTSRAYWWDGTFAAAGRISDVAATTNHSLNGLLARALGEGSAARVGYLVGGALLAAGTLAVAARWHRRGAELPALTLVGLGSAAVAPFAWSHHWVWFVPLVVVLGHRAVAARDRVAGGAARRGAARHGRGDHRAARPRGRPDPADRADLAVPRTPTWRCSWSCWSRPLAGQSGSPGHPRVTRQGVGLQATARGSLIPAGQRRTVRPLCQRCPSTGYGADRTLRQEAA